MALLRVLYDFAAEEDGELNVAAGDVVRPVEDDGASDKDGWSLVEVVAGPRAGSSGFIPSEYATPLADGGAAGDAGASPAQPRFDATAAAPAAAPSAAAPAPAGPGSADPLVSSLRSIALAASTAGGTAGGSSPSAPSPGGGLSSALSRSLLPPPGGDAGAAYGATSAGGYGVPPPPTATLPPSSGVPGSTAGLLLSPEEVGRLFGAHEEWYRAATMKRQETYRGLQGEVVDLLRGLSEAEGRSASLLSRIGELEALISDERARWTARLAEDAAAR